MNTARSDTFIKHPKTFQVGPNPECIVAADFDGDGRPEIVTTDRGPLADPREERPAQDQLSFLTADEDLKYSRQGQLSTGFAPYALAVANVDALKAPDIVVANFLATRNRDITLLRFFGTDKRGQRPFFEPKHFSVSDAALTYNRMRDGDNQPYFTTPGLTSVVIADMDGDGYRDAVATGWSSDMLIIMRGSADEYFGETELFDCPGGPRDVQTADLNGDGHLDLAVVLYSSSEIALWEGDGKGNFEEVSRFLAHGRLPTKIRIADMNGDGKSDLVVSHSHAEDSITIFFQTAPMTFEVMQEIRLGTQHNVVEYEIRDILVGDFSGDGRTDLAVAGFAAKEVTVFINNSKDSKLPQSYDRESYTFSAGRPRALCQADFNGDGKVDLGVGLWETNSVALLLGR